MTSHVPPVSPPPAPADVGIVAALMIEVAPFLARLKGARKYAGPKYTVIEGECAGKVVATIAAGVGRSSSARGASMLQAGHRPRWLISAGFAGALGPALRRNDIVLASEVACEDESAPCFQVDLELGPSDGPSSRVIAGRSLTVDRIIRTAAEKSELRERHGADFVDMESHAVAAFCAERSIRFLAVRAISDEAGTDLPAEVLSVVGPTGGFRLGAAMGAIWKRPGSIKALWELREHAHEAAERLARALPGIIGRLP